MMSGKLHELKKSEEGQTLVLAAIFGLVLMVCVLGTVNLGRAVYDKVQLQAAADSAAYSQAAVEARVMNFTAYTNRAMVVHYASMMAATSYLSYLHFEWPLLKAALQVLSKLPYIGPAAAAIEQVAQTLVQFLDSTVLTLGFLIAAANIALYGFQEGAWWGLYFGRLSKSMPPEGHSGDSAAHPYVPIWPTLLPAANMAVFAQTRGHALMPLNSLETLKILINDRSDVVQEARLHMLEVANSARQPWVAYGDRFTRASLWPSARHWKWPILGNHLWLGSRARTEMGSFVPKGGIGGLTSATGQIWSGQQVALGYDFKLILHFHGSDNFFTFVAMDQVAKAVAPRKNSYFGGFSPSSIVGKALYAFFPPLKSLNKAVQGYAQKTRPNPDYRFFWLSPYVYFSPRASNKASLVSPGNFGQPDVLVGLALEGRDYNREGRAATTYGRRFSWGGGAAGKGATDFSYTNADWPRAPGVQVLHKGFNAFSAAQAYYHRPGDWKEQPNFFNPLWGARLMPVTESNVWAKLPFSALPLFKQFLLH